MKNQNNTRVLVRQGARELTVVEMEVVNGAFAHTNVCSSIGMNAATLTHTGGDGDGCSDTDS